MATVENILDALFSFAPIEAKMDFDNVGLLAGSPKSTVSSVLVALDITPEVLEEANAKGANLIVSHHPLMFSEKNVTDTTYTGRRLIYLLSRGISAICMHTNLDAARGGVNDELAKVCGLTNVINLSNDGHYSDGTAFSFGRIGDLQQPSTMRDYLGFLKTRLKSHGLRYHNSGRPVSKVAVLGGSGGDYLHKAYEKGCDTFVTSDIKYDVFLEARDLGINLIDGDHFCTENVIVPVISAFLRETFPTLTCFVSDTHGQTARFFV